jgi:hypothetical protein
MNFKTQKEIYAALLEGKTIVSLVTRDSVSLHESGAIRVVTKNGEFSKNVYSFCDPTEWELYVPSVKISVDDFEDILIRELDDIEYGTLAIRDIKEALLKGGYIS